MKKLIFILFIFNLFSCHQENKKGTKISKNSTKTQGKKITKFLTEIDDLKTEKEVHTFLKKHNFENFQLSSIQKITKKEDYTHKIADSLNITKSFYKADFDQNGYIDLLIIVNKPIFFDVLTILSFPNDSLRLNRLTNNTSPGIVPIIKENGMIDIYSQNEYVGFMDTIPSNTKKESTKKTLTYKYGNFIEYNPKIRPHHIEKIEFSAGGCFGPCPIFNLELTKNKESKFIAEEYNFDDNLSNWIKDGKGNFKTKLKAKNWEELTEILNYIDFINLKNEYSILWTDHRTLNLTIYYDDGKVKKISDYGGLGTYGLTLMYEKLFDIRKNQDWKKAD